MEAQATDSLLVLQLHQQESTLVVALGEQVLSSSDLYLKKAAADAEVRKGQHVIFSPSAEAEGRQNRASRSSSIK